MTGVQDVCSSDLLKKGALKDWYELYPERFQNKTNGITQRRWLALCNPELSALITKLLGNADWVKNLDELKKLEKYADDEAVLNEFMAVKEAQKNRLAAFVKEHDGVDIDPNIIFDIQIKRLHEYKRQFLNALSILYIYYGIKDGSIKDFTPTTFIFGAKSAQRILSRWFSYRTTTFPMRKSLLLRLMFPSRYLRQALKLAVQAT